MAFAAYVYLIVPTLKTPNGPPIGHASGLFLFAWLIFSFYMMIASFRVSKILSAIFLTLVPALILLTIGAFKGNDDCTKAGGWIGISEWLFRKLENSELLLTRDWRQPMVSHRHVSFAAVACSLRLPGVVRQCRRCDQHHLRPHRAACGPLRRAQASSSACAEHRAQLHQRARGAALQEPLAHGVVRHCEQAELRHQLEILQ